MQNPPPGPPPGGDQPGYPPEGGQQQGYPPPGQQPPGYPPPGQQPPAYPPQGYQQQYQQQPYQAAGGVDKKTGAILSYLLGWITGIIFLFVGKNDPDVKYHAAQSTIFFGGMTVIFWALRILESFLPGVISFLLALIGVVLGFYTFIMWIVCLVQANNNAGARFQIPIVGSYVTPYAEQLANAVS